MSYAQGQEIINILAVLLVFAFAFWLLVLFHVVHHWEDK